MNFWEPLYQYLLSVEPLVYLAIVIAIMYLENLFPPVPGDSILVFSTYVYTVNHYSVSALFILSIIASMTGFMTTFWLGRHWGKEFFLIKNYRFMPALFIRKVENLFSAWGMTIITVSRFLPGLRAVIALFSGFSNFSARKVILLATFSTLLWNGLLVGVGIYLGENWQAVEMVLRRYSHFVTVIIIVIVVIWITNRFADIKKIKGDKS